MYTMYNAIYAIYIYWYLYYWCVHIFMPCLTSCLTSCTRVTLSFRLADQKGTVTELDPIWCWPRRVQTWFIHCFATFKRQITSITKILLFNFKLSEAEFACWKGFESDCKIKPVRVVCIRIHREGWYILYNKAAIQFMNSIRVQINDVTVYVVVVRSRCRVANRGFSCEYGG
jgi:hypothetical protein